MSLLLHSTIIGFLSNVYALDFIPDYGAYSEATGFTDACWYGTASENVCTNNGFCSTTSDGKDASCDCTYGWGGDYCTENTLLDFCTDEWCFNGGECTVGLNAVEGASCYCQTGYSGDRCEIEDETVDVCEDITCSGNGNCIEALGGTSQWECVCEVGFGGPACGESLDYCTGVFLLDIFSRLAITSGDLNASMECGYSTPSLFEDTHPSSYDSETFSYCICADILNEYAYDDYINQLDTCVTDKWRSLTFFEETDAYCPFCDDNQDAIMEELITSKSDTCYHFVYERDTMSLYWRTMWKCFCMYSIGTPSTIETIVNCPFTMHTAQSDFISWQNCKSDRICEWKDMYRYFEEDYAKIDLLGSIICKDFVESWIFTTPEDYILLEDMSGFFCPCLETIRGHCDDCDFALDCVPITFHELSMIDAFDQICNDELITNRDCINYVGYIAIELGTLNFTAATMCYAAMDLSATLYTLSDNLKALMCGCLGPAVTLMYEDSYQNDNFDTAMGCIDSHFAMDLTSCPSDLYDGASFNIPDDGIETLNTEETTEETTFSDMNRHESEQKIQDDKIASLPNARLSSSDYWESSSVWKSITIAEVVALVVLSGSAFGMNRQRRRKA